MQWMYACMLVLKYWRCVFAPLSGASVAIIGCLGCRALSDGWFPCCQSPHLIRVWYKHSVLYIILLTSIIVFVLLFSSKWFVMIRKTLPERYPQRACLATIISTCRMKSVDSWQGRVCSDRLCKHSYANSRAAVQVAARDMLYLRCLGPKNWNHLPRKWLCTW